jgi:hypothetical protein
VIAGAPGKAAARIRSASPRATGTRFRRSGPMRDLRRLRRTAHVRRATREEVPRVLTAAKRRRPTHSSGRAAGVL